MSAPGYGRDNPRARLAIDRWPETGFVVRSVAGLVRDAGARGAGTIAQDEPFHPRTTPDQRHCSSSGMPARTSNTAQPHAVQSGQMDLHRCLDRRPTVTRGPVVWTRLAEEVNGVRNPICRTTRTMFHVKHRGWAGCPVKRRGFTPPRTRCGWTSPTTSPGRVRAGRAGPGRGRGRGQGQGQAGSGRTASPVTGRLTPHLRRRGRPHPDPSHHPACSPP